MLIFMPGFFFNPVIKLISVSEEKCGSNHVIISYLSENPKSSRTKYYQRDRIKRMINEQKG